MPQKKQPAEDLSAGEVDDLSAGAVDETTGGGGGDTRKPSFLEPHEEKTIGQHIKETGRGTVAGVVNPILHPVETLKSMGQAIIASGTTGASYPTIGPTGNRERDLANIRRQEQASQQATEEGGKAMREHPGYTVGTMLGPALLAKGAEQLGRVPITKEGFVREAARTATGVGERSAKKFIEKTVEENKAAEAKAVKDTSEAQAKHTESVEKITEANKEAVTERNRDAIEIQKQNEAARDQVSRKGAIARGMQTLRERLKDGIQQTEKQVRSEGNRRYQAVHEQYDAVEVPLDDVIEDVQAAKAKLKGSKESIKVFSDILTRAESEESELGAQRSEIMRGQQEQGAYADLSPERRANIDRIVTNVFGDTPVEPQAVTFRDLQGYYSELGRKLASGTLPGDVYQAMKTLRESIGNRLEEISPQYRDANAYWKKYMETFKEPAGPSGSASPVAKAFLAEDGFHAMKPFLEEGSGSRGIEMLAKYNPQLAKLANEIRKYQSEFDSLPEKAKEKPAPPPAKQKALPKEPKPVTPEITKVGPEEMQQAQRAELAKTTDRLHKTGAWLLPITAWEGLRAFATGRLDRVVELSVAMPAFFLARGSIVRLLENPKTIELITHPSAEELGMLEKLPPEYRQAAAARINQVATTAKEQGIAISPKILAFATANAARGTKEPNRTDLMEKGAELVGAKPEGMVEKGNIELRNRQQIPNNGKTSTVYSTSFEEDGIEILVPRAADGKILSEKEAIDRYHRTGEHLGKFRDSKTADAYASSLHDAYESGELSSKP